MTTFPPFTHKGYTIRVHLLREDRGAPMWIAEVDHTEMVHIIPARHDDDPERIRHLVRDWIDDGMPNGGPGA